MVGGRPATPVGHREGRAWWFRRGRSIGLRATVVGLSLLLGGCFLSPTKNPGDYRTKAGNSAQAMVSNIQSAVLATTLELKGRSTEELTNDLVSEAESDSGSVITAFDSRQPPDAGSERLMKEIDGPLEKASDDLTSLRIAVRDGDRAAMVRTIRWLRRWSARLTKLYGQLS